MFDLEDDWDYLYLFDGPNDQSPQIAGSPFTGTNSPGQFTSSGGALTFRFYSDVSTVAPGFLATYQCNLQAAPVAEFALSELVICLGDSIQLQNNSTDADTYSWSVNSGGLSSATDEEPYLFPMSSGNYTISLEVTNSAGSDQLQQQFAIQVYEAPIAIGNATNNVVTLPNGIATFENNSLNATSYLWDFGDGNTSSDEEPWHQYSSGGSYSVLLIAGNEGCGNDTITIELEVQSLNINELYDNGLSIYPNPNNGVFTIAGTTAGNLLILTDIYGKVVWKGSAVEQMTEVDLLFLSAGIYHLNYGSEVYKILVE
jgi:PKD repeat protein